MCFCSKPCWDLYCFWMPLMALSASGLGHVYSHQILVDSQSMAKQLFSWACCWCISAWMSPEQHLGLCGGEAWSGEQEVSSWTMQILCLALCSTDMNEFKHDPSCMRYRLCREEARLRAISSVLFLPFKETLGFCCRAPEMGSLSSLAVSKLFLTNTAFHSLVLVPLTGVTWG